jgi:hypothetical protein
MPGAFAHITAGNIAGSNINLKKLDMPNEAKLCLSRHMKFIELGCVSPDYPYLAITDSDQSIWADQMHYEKTGEMIKAAITAIKGIDDKREQDKAFAWICGYTAHVIADITIHPVVERKVGPYEENQTAHRTCEMHQDTHIWQRLGLGEIGLADRVKLNIGGCSDIEDKDKLDPTIKQVWLHTLSQVHPEIAASTPADLDKWHKGFQIVVDTADEGYRFFPWARHVAVDNGLLYPRPNEVDDQYIVKLGTPAGPLDYDDIFDRAVTNTGYYWCIVANAVYENGDVSEILNWNLDNGQCPEGNLTAWEM